MQNHMTELSILALDNHLLIEIFKHLTLLEICIAAATCKRLQSIADHIHQRRRHSIFDFYSEISDKYLIQKEFQMIADSLGKYITTIVFDSDIFDVPTEIDLSRLQYFPNLKKIIFASISFHYDGNIEDPNENMFEYNLNHLSKHNNNRQLIIDSAFISDEDLKTIYNFWPFNELHLNFSYFECIYEDFYIQFNGDYLKTVQGIEALTLDTCYGLTPLKLHNFCWSNLKTLKRLKFRLHNNSIEDSLEYIQVIFRFENLEELLLYDYCGEMLSSINWNNVSLKNLKKFGLSVKINNAIELIRKLMAINKLECLSLYDSSIEFIEIDYQHLMFTNLKHLDLRSIQLHSKHLIQLATMNRSLNEIHFSYKNKLIDGLLRLIEISINLEKLTLCLYELLPIKVLTDICNVQKLKINNKSKLQIILRFHNKCNNSKKFQNEYDNIIMSYSRWISVDYAMFFEKYF